VVVNKSRAFVIFIGLLSLAAVVLAQATTSSSGQPLDVMKLQVLKKTVLPMQDILEDSSLSPDGSHLARMTDSQLCVSLISGKEKTCVLFNKEKIKPDLDSLQWSSDGSKIVFEESGLLRIGDFNFWIFDVKTKKLVKLTVGSYGSSNCSPLVKDGSCRSDGMPSFSSDGQHVFYVHRESGMQQLDSMPIIFAVSLDGGKITATLNHYVNAEAYAVAPDDKVVVFSTGRNAYYWFVEIGGFDKQGSKRVKFDFSTVTLPSKFIFSDNQKYILTASRALITASLPQREDLDSQFRIINLETEKVIKVDNSQSVVAAAWQPGGSAMVYSTRNHVDPSKDGLFIISAPGQLPRKLMSGTFIKPDFMTSVHRYWASNNTVLLREIQGQSTKLVLFKLGQK
jgi:Tol biopolymer transport system component